MPLIIECVLFIFLLPLHTWHRMFPQTQKQAGQVWSCQSQRHVPKMMIKESNVHTEKMGETLLTTHPRYFLEDKTNGLAEWKNPKPCWRNCLVISQLGLMNPRKAPRVRWAPKPSNSRDICNIRSQRLILSCICSFFFSLICKEVNLVQNSRGFVPACLWDGGGSHYMAHTGLELACFRVLSAGIAGAYPHAWHLINHTVAH